MIKNGATRGFVCVLLCQLASMAGSCTSSTTASGETSLTCPVVEALCPMIYKPALCWIGTQTNPTLRATGSNSCVARLELNRLWCEKHSSAGEAAKNGASKGADTQQSAKKLFDSGLVSCADDELNTP